MLFKSKIISIEYNKSIKKMIEKTKMQILFVNTFKNFSNKFIDIKYIENIYKFNYYKFIKND